MAEEVPIVRGENKFSICCDVGDRLLGRSCREKLVVHPEEVKVMKAMQEELGKLELFQVIPISSEEQGAEGCQGLEVG